GASHARDQLLEGKGLAPSSPPPPPAILALKSSQTSTPDQAGAAAQRLSDWTPSSSGRITAVGNVIARTDPADAHVWDIVSGDEVANAGTVDLSKVQQLLITILLLGVY